MTEETIFEAALALCDPAERSAYLDGACGGDPGLRRRVEALLASEEKMGDFLERPAAEQLGAVPAGPRAVTGAEPHDDDEEINLDFLQPSDKPGSLGRLAYYEVLQVLGQGGSGIVLKAFDEECTGWSRSRSCCQNSPPPCRPASAPARGPLLRRRPP